MGEPALSLGAWWEKPAANDEVASGAVVYMRARYYDPAIRRFISEDPTGLDGGLNFYAYAGGNPIIFIDPSGLTIQGTRVDSVRGRFGVFGAANVALSGVFQVSADVDLFSSHSGSNPGGHFPLITQGAGVTASILGKPIVNLGFRRSSTNGGLSFSDFEFNASHPNLNGNNGGVNLTFGGGLFVGGNVDITIISPAR